ncbi:MAG: TonB-dependent receptor [Gallionella sp.]|nr:TonB-dependent receptor [Gallionella sp.]
MRLTGKHSYLFILVLFSACSAWAQSSDEEDLALIYGDKVNISIATGNPQPLRRAPSVASVITAEDIAAMGATDLDEALESVPGMHVSHSNVSYAPLYTLRGIFSANNPQTLMLLNGIPTTTMFTGSKGNAWGGLPLENVARIEIIRGPGSALYGADAYAGVINIITKSAAESAGTQFGARYGSFNTRDAWVQHGGKWGAVDVAAYLRVGDTDGFKRIITADAQTRLDGIFATSASLAPGNTHLGHDAVDASLDLAYEKWHLRNGYKLRSNLQLGAGVASALDPSGSEKSERITTELSWIDPAISDNMEAGFNASLLQYNDTILSPLVIYPAGVTFPTGTFANGMLGSPEKWERNTRLSAYATYTGFESHQLRVGIGHDDLNLYKTAEHKNFTLTPTGLPVPLGAISDFSNTAPFMRPQRRKIDYVYVQDEWSFAPDWALTAGVRHDNYSDFGGTTNPRLALVWEASLDLTAKLLYGRAFRAPSFVELYSINNPVQQGNPSLKPETNQTLEAAITWQARKDILLNLNFFHYEMKDIIRLVPNVAPAVGSSYSNTGQQHGNGMELESVWDYSPTMRLTGNYSYQNSTDDATGQDAGYAPHHRLYLRSDWRYASGWLASTQLNRVMDRMRAAGDTRPKIPDYTTVDLTVRSPGYGEWTFSTSVRNLFNADVREPSLAPGSAIPNDLPMAPRSLWLQANYRM